MRLLEANAAKTQDEEALKKEANAVIRDMLAARKKFDLDRYFASLCTNQVCPSGDAGGPPGAATARRLGIRLPVPFVPPFPSLTGPFASPRSHSLQCRWCAWPRTSWSST